MKTEWPKRRQTRLKGYDYSACGAYFVTVCTAGRRRILSDIRRGDPCGRPYSELTGVGKIVESTFNRVEDLYGVEIDYYMIMPDHVHFILILPDHRATARIAPTVGQVVGAYKSMAVQDYRNVCNRNGITMGKIWQRGFFEHIIRNRGDLVNARRYIIDNPRRWLIGEETE